MASRTQLRCLILIAFAGLSAACVAAPASTRTRRTMYVGDSEAKPSVQTLPSPSVGRDELSEHWRMAWMLAEESFDVLPPKAASGRSFRELEQWAVTDLARWIALKSERVDGALEELNDAAVVNDRERTMAGGMMGLLYEDVAYVLSRMPVPSELDSEPEIAEMYRGLVVYQARPYFEHALLAYRACAYNAQHVERLGHWSGYCARRAENLDLSWQALQPQGDRAERELAAAGER